jgi:hypothetical protein
VGNLSSTERRAGGGRAPSQILPQARGGYWACLIAFFVLVTALFTYPLLLHLGDSIPGAPALDAFDQWYEVWWLKHSLFEQGISPTFNPDIFYPYGYPMLAARHNALANSILTLPLSLAAGATVAYNLVSLATFVLSALGAYLLAFYHTRRRTAGVVAGIVFAFCQYRIFALNTGHFPPLGTQWFPFLFLYLEKTMRVRQKAAAVMSALFYSLSALASLYYVPMAGIVVVLYVLVRARPWRAYWISPRFWYCIVTFGATVLVLCGPLLYPTLQLHLSGRYAPIPIQGTWISASPLDFLVPNVFHPLFGKYVLPHYVRNSHGNFVSLGVIPLVLMVIGLWRNRARFASVYKWLVVLSILLAMGPVLQLGGRPVYLAVPSLVEKAFTLAMTFMSKRLALNATTFYWELWVKDAIYIPLPNMLLYWFVPFFNLANYVSRFGVFAAMATAVLAGAGAARLIDAMRGDRFSNWHRPALTALLVGLLLFELFPAPLPFGLSALRPQSADEWLAKQEGDFAVMKYPLAMALLGTAHWSTVIHGKKIVYGYGSFVPRTFTDNLELLTQFPAARSLSLLRQWGVRYVLVYPLAYGGAWPGLSAQIEASPELRQVIDLQEAARWSGDRVLGHLPGYEPWFVADRVVIYEIVK